MTYFLTESNGMFSDNDFFYSFGEIQLIFDQTKILISL